MDIRLTLGVDMTIGEQGEAEEARRILVDRVNGHPANPDLAVWQDSEGRCWIWRGSASWDGDFDSPAAALAHLQAELDGA